MSIFQGVSQLENIRKAIHRYGGIALLIGAVTFFTFVF